MDFHCLARRDLQSLCKRNKIPANMTNIAMADALQALQSVEGIAEIQEALQFQSPKKPDLLSPAPLPRTTGRRTAPRKLVGPAREEASAEEELWEQQGSPLPRSRRVIARAPEIDEAEEEEEGAKKEVPETPKAPNTRRRGASKKEEGAVAEALTVTTRRRATKKEVVKTPAAERTDRRASALQAAEAQKEENPAGATAGRRARQSSEKEVEEEADLMSEGLRRSTRVRGRGAWIKMTSLAKEEEVQEKEADDSVDQKNDEEEEKEIKDNERAMQEAEVSADLDTEEKQEKSSDESFELVREVSENNQNQEEEEEKDQEEDGNDAVAAGFDGSPIRGLIDRDSNQQQQNPAAEITAADDGEFELQEPSTTVDLGSEEIAAEISAETTESGEFDGEMMEKSERDTGDNDQTTEITVGSPAVCVGDKVTADVTEESGDVHSEITAKTDDSDDENGGDLVAVDVLVEIDESGTDLLAGEIAVEAIVEEQEQVPKIAGEPRDEVRELIDDLSDLNLSANDEMPPAVSSDNKENGDLTSLTAVEVGPRGVVKQKFESMSLRKLKAVYKETLVTINTINNNKVEGKRAALKAIDDNCI